MNMNRIECKALLALGMMALLSSLHAQTPGIPSKLGGKWATPDSQNGQLVAVTIDAKQGTGTLSLSFADRRCTVREAPMSLGVLGGRLTLKSEGYSNPCIEELVLEMVPNPGRDGEVGYLGELRLRGSAANRAPILRGRLTLP